MSLIHPRLLATLERFYPSTVAIQAATPVVASSGSTTFTYANVTGMESLGCAVVPRGGGERRDVQFTHSEATVAILVRGHYPSITPRHFALVGSTRYELLLVEHDSQGATTRLEGREVLT